MIKDLFVPQVIGDFSLFTQRIVALEITEMEIIAAVVIWRGKKKTIEQVLQESLSQDLAIPFKDRSKTALQKIMQQIGSFTKIIVVAPSSKLIFKEISVPAMSWQKIKILLPFEVEALLPFPLDQALIDGIVVHQGSKEQNTEVFVVAAKQDIIQELNSLLIEAGIKPNVITTDLVELYSFYCALPLEPTLQTTLLLDLEPSHTRLLLSVEGKLEAMRVLPQGFKGQENDLRALFALINVTVENFLSKVRKDALERIIVCGQGVEKEGIQELVTDFMHAPCRSAPLTQLLREDIVATAQDFEHANRCIVPVTAALSFVTTEEFNLDTHVADQKTNSLITKQLIITLSLIGSILLMLLINSMVIQRQLNAELSTREQQAITLITQQLNLTLPKVRGKTVAMTLDQVNNLAQAKVAQEEELWFTLSSQNRFAFLSYLQTLSSLLNRQDLGLELRQLTMSEDTDTITLDGRVKNFEALHAFEDALNQASLFKSVTKPQDLKFTVKAVLDKSQKEEA